MATEPSNQQNVLMPNDLQYINAILSTVHDRGMNATARYPQSWGKELLSHLEFSGLFTTVTQEITARSRSHLKESNKKLL
jgi:hypothetical protein